MHSLARHHSYHYIHCFSADWHLVSTLPVPVCKNPTHFHSWDSRQPWPVHCMMTTQFTKLQASWNPALKKAQTLPELLIDYWWRPDKCTRLTVPMTFLSPGLGPRRLPICRRQPIQKLSRCEMSSFESQKVIVCSDISAFRSRPYCYIAPARELK